VQNGTNGTNRRCEELKDLLPLMPLGRLDPLDETAVRRHLDGGCPRCAAELAALKAALYMMAFALPEEQPSAMAGSRLMARVRAEAGASSVTPGRVETRAPAPAGAVWRLAAAAVLAAVAASWMTGMALDRRQRVEIAALRDRLDRQMEELTTLRRQVLQAGDAIRLASAPGVRVFDLAGREALAASSARVFWDPMSAAWRLYAANLPPATPGKTYQLWLITPSRKISAGTFTGLVAAEATGFLSLPSDAGTVVAAAVTDEPEGGSPQPTGSILLLGKI